MIQPLIHITRKQALWFAGFLVFYEFLVYIANDMIMPGMLDVIHTYHAPKSAIASSLTAYVLGGASLQLLLGPLSDRFGRRPIMLFGAFWFALFTLILPWSQSIHQFLLARFFEGMGLCYINVVGYALLQDIFGEEDAIRVIAIMANIAILGPLIGPLAGAQFLQYGDWKAIFYLLGGLSILTGWGLYRYMPESVGQIKRDGHKIKRSRLSLGGTLTNYKILAQHRVFVFGTLAYGLMGVICIVWIALSPRLLVDVYHLTLLQYGLWQIPVFGAFIVGNVLLSYLSVYYTALQLSFMGSMLVFFGALLMWMCPVLFGYDIIWIMPGLIVYSVGYGMAVTALNRFILFVTQIGTGTTSALISCVSMCFLAAGTEAANYLFEYDHFAVFTDYAAWVGVAYIMCVLLGFSYHKRDNALGVDNL